MTLAAHSFLWNLECLHSPLKTSDPGFVPKIMATPEKMLFGNIYMQMHEVAEVEQRSLTADKWKKDEKVSTLNQRDAICLELDTNVVENKLL